MSLSETSTNQFVTYSQTIRESEDPYVLRKKQKDRYTIVTSAPSLINALKKSKQWNCKHFGRFKAHNGVLGRASEQRITASFELK